MDERKYPSNFFDPFANEPTRAECAKCGDNCDIDDMEQGDDEKLYCADCADEVVTVWIARCADLQSANKAAQAALQVFREKVERLERIEAAARAYAERQREKHLAGLPVPEDIQALLFALEK